MPHVSSSNRQRGYTLIEMMVTLVIISILASVALPYAKLNIIREQERELKVSLREIRSAIDHFHLDWQEGRINKVAGVASKQGYPINLDILVDGVPLSGKLDEKKKYLRRIPLDPFMQREGETESAWRLIGYRNEVDDEDWNGEDVYDIRSQSERSAINNSNYRDW